MNIYVAKRRDCYWKCSSDSDAGLRKWEKALRRDLARPQKELRVIPREIRRRKNKHDQEQMSWLFGGDDERVVRFVELPGESPVDD
jgi:hypothetical protein